MEERKIREILFEIELERKKILRPKFLELGLSIGEGQPRILKSLLEKGEMNQRELADICMIDTTTISRVIDKMEKAGFLKRNSDILSRRSYIITLTEKGRECAKEVKKIFEEIDKKICQNIDESELIKLYSILEKIKLNLR